MPSTQRKTAPDWHRDAACKVQLSDPKFPSSEGRLQVIHRLLSACLDDRALCRLLDAHRDGLILRVPPLRELHRLRVAS